MPDIIKVTNLVKRFNGFTAVDGISFSMPKGNFYGLLGPNGAGKTTTIRMLYGFSPPTEGELRIFGMDIATEWRKIKTKMGICHQENTLDPDLTVEQNLHIYAGYFAVPGKKARERTDELLAFFALDHRRHAKVRELSGGMARRLILARALINQPDLLILDEPTTGLDPQSRHQVWEKLEELKKTGLSVLITTHYMEEAERLCDRLVIIDHGRILVEGDPKTLKCEHAGDRIVEIVGPDPELRSFVSERRIENDDLGTRMLLYLRDGNEVEDTIRERFCMDRCVYRGSTLEDVFLRLTGRELRE
ncbi:MAG: ABC transporter ATP-binding protein [Desulfobacteraceae bacterium]|jgi:lipooligosaccharide transport system ATP-binding protein|nr:ABC transporter ATP-binding protein [Desulfobacteraceae bacterium]